MIDGFLNMSWGRLLQYGETASLADWFGGFCAVHQTDAPAADDAGADKAEGQEAAKPKRKPGRPKKDANQVPICFSYHLQGCFLIGCPLSILS